ncbi:AraC family transcriptional regulator [Bradyrhizobium sp. BRP19]|uniref:AraC family transcriptional regulator n=1 Tax=Bradyrhizobium sp. BRP19 TaxID=2793823 RepID=UPI001CD60199
MSHLERMRTLVTRNTHSDGIFSTDIPALALVRYPQASEPLHMLYEPALCLVVQGAKQVVLGSDLYRYDPETYLIVSVDLPVVSQVTNASRERPFLAIRLDLDLAALRDLAVQLRLRPGRDQAHQPGLQLHQASLEVGDAVCRLLELLDHPESIPILAPMVKREILYRLLVGSGSARILQIAVAESRLSRINKAIAMLKNNFRHPLRVEVLADQAGINLSSFHLHFKQVTGMSPLQYQKALRLQEARRLMLGLSLDAATAGFNVGYESPSQFSREYERLFGAPPVRDLARLRGMPSHLLEG